MNRTYEICFTVYLDDARTQANSNLNFVTTTVTAFMPQQVQAIIEAQYGGRVHVWHVRSI